MLLLHVIFDASGFYGSYSLNMEEKQLSFIQRLKLSKNMPFRADADI